MRRAGPSARALREAMAAIRQVHPSEPCGGTTHHGTPCRRLVRWPGRRCHSHSHADCPSAMMRDFGALIRGAAMMSDFGVLIGKVAR